QHLEAQPVGLNELGLHIRHPAYRPVTIPRRRHRPADQWRSERCRDPCTFRLVCHAPLGLAADAERPPAAEITSLAFGASKNAILLAPVPRRMSALTRRKSTLFQWLAVPLWVPTGKDSVPTDSGHSGRVLLDPAARLELGARWVNS